jgi:hypothetical protein
VTTDLIALLRKNLQELESASGVLALSYRKCKDMVVKPGLSNDQMESFEALTARFARLSDLIVQKTLRALDAIDLEDSGTVRDRINRAEKKGYIQSAETLVRIRMLRNEIAHEYKAETILEIFENVLLLTPEILEMTETLISVGSQKEVK